MTFAKVLTHFNVGDRVPYRNASGKLTGKGSFVVLRIETGKMTIEIPNRNERLLHERDWDEVEQNLTALQKSRSVCQSMQTQNTTYILSLRYFPIIAAQCS